VSRYELEGGGEGLTREDLLDTGWAADSDDVGEGPVVICLNGRKGCLDALRLLS
jgi:hypothetical protein